MWFAFSLLAVIMIDPPATASSSSTSLDVLPSPAVHAVALKLPPFWPNDPVVWFAQVEAQFIPHNITSQSTQFAYVISSLPPEIAQEIRDLLLSPPSEHPYDTLKSELIRRTSASEQKRLHQLLISEELGDRKPSQLLRKMRQLLGDKVLEDGILRQLFLQRLPTNVQLILASLSTTSSLDQLALIADNILEVAPSQPTLATLASPPAASSFTQDLQDLRSQVHSLTSQLTTLVNALQINSRSRSRGRSPTPPLHTPRHSASTSRSNRPHCWYHMRFGPNARKCVPPCSFDSAASTRQPENFPASD